MLYFDASYLLKCYVLESVYLRAAGALHLVHSRDSGFTEIDRSDRHLLEAASFFKLKGRNILAS